MDIILENISKSFSGVKVLEDLNVTLIDGGVTCIMGPSGCGKTTLLNIVAGLVAPDSGKLVGVSGRRMAYAFQEPRLLPWKTVLENVSFVIGSEVPKMERRSRAMRCLEIVDLADAAEDYPVQLSGGMAQRVSLARALAADADFIILDEPFSALDNELKDRLVARLKELFSRRCMTAVVVTHSEEEAASLGGRVYRLG